MAAAYGLLRLSPDAFWAMTPREVALALRPFAGPVLRPLGRGELDALMRAHPDAETDHGGDG